MIVDEDKSPGQITGVLRKEEIHIVKPTIYNHIHADGRERLTLHTLNKLKYRKIVKFVQQTKATVGHTNIHLRPAEADGTRFRDWMMNTIIDPYDHTIITNVSNI